MIRLELAYLLLCWAETNEYFGVRTVAEGLQFLGLSTQRSDRFVEALARGLDFGECCLDLLGQLRPGFEM